MNKYKKYFFLISLSLAVGGCATHTDSVGDKMVLEGERTKTLGTKWSDGHHLVEKGHQHVHHGEQLVKKGEEEIHKGRTQINKGSQIIRSTENAYIEHQPTVPVVPG